MSGIQNEADALHAAAVAYWNKYASVHQVNADSVWVQMGPLPILVVIARGQDMAEILRFLEKEVKSEGR